MFIKLFNTFSLLKKNDAISILIIFIIGILNYWHLTSHTFLGDDFEIIYDFLNSGKRSNNFFRIWTEVSLYIDYYFFKTTAFGFYIHNILLHILNSILLFFLVKAVSPFFINTQKQQQFFPLICSLFFLVYPFHVEGIAWISARVALLACFWGTLSLILFIQYLKLNKKTFLLFSLISFFIGLLSYESLWTFPFIILLFLYFLRNNHSKSTFFIALHFFYFVFIWIVYCIARVIYTNSFWGNYTGNALSHYSTPKISYNFFTLFCRSFTPGMNNSLVFIGCCCIVFVVFLLLIYLLVFKQHKNLSAIYVFIGSFLISLIPVSIFGISTHTSEGERFLYFPSLFITLIIGYVIIQFNKKIMTFLFISIMCLSVLLTQFSLKNYNIASKCARYSTLYFSKIKENFILINVPDSYGGAPLFRAQRILKALSVFYPTYNVSKINISSYQNFPANSIISTSKNILGETSISFQKDSFYIKNKLIENKYPKQMIYYFDNSMQIKPY